MKRDVKKAIKRRVDKISDPIRFIGKSISKYHEAETQKKAGEMQKKEDSRLLKEQKQEMGVVVEQLREKTSAFDRDHIWAFNSGNTGKDFRGNPKYLFAYINYYRKDIFAYWVCPDPDTVDLVNSLGFTAVLSGTAAAEYLVEKTGVCVSEQAKHFIPFKNVKYLNLWHGMGYKLTERSRTFDGDDLRLDLCGKYIKNNSVYLDRMILAVTCPMQEEQFLKDFRISRDHMLRIGYARCTYQQNYQKLVTFDHDIRKKKNLPADTRLAVFAPTFRNKQGNTFLEAMQDLSELHKCCEKNHILMIFKMHPIMETEPGYLNAVESYKDKPYFYFWDNRDDIYEIMDQIDLLVYDYSSIYSDFLIAGVKHYIRYIYDMDEMVAQGNFESVDEYYSRTSGTICFTFGELLDAMGHFEDTYDPEETARICKMQWEYAGENDFEKTVDTVLNFEVKEEKHETLYSFDIFDTLISRTGLDPMSIFYAVKERMETEGGYPKDFVQRYAENRHSAEFSERALMQRSKDQRGTEKVEITMKQIFDRLQSVYGLSEEQKDQLMNWEIEEELNAVVPLPKQINRVKELLKAGNTVILISDMYLPKEVITRMLAKADPVLAELPFYLSNEYGVLKTSSLLFFEVYRNTKPFYYFGKWIHYGDNFNADFKQPRTLGITARQIDKLEFSGVEEKKTQKIARYDAYRIAAMEARMREQYTMAKAEFVIDLVAPIMVSYVDWACRDALQRGIRRLYFVSRDGHPLKRIADALIRRNHWNLETRYIYASRRLWRIPSYIDEIDVDYWSNYGGNFNDIRSKEKLLQAMDIDDESVFSEMFPEIKLDNIDFGDWSGDVQPAKQLVPAFQASKAFREYLLKRAEQERKLVCGYLKQEIDPDIPSAYVEFYGRGYNQTCHSRLWNHTLGRDDQLIYYYAKSVQPSEGFCTRLNMTVSDLDLFFMESIFANMPYKSVEQYKVENGRIEPVLVPILCDRDLYDAMQLLLPEYADRYAALNLSDPVGMDHAQFDFMLEYFRDNKTDPFLYENFGGLVDAVSMYADKMQFARPYTQEDLERFKNGGKRGDNTRSITMSYERSLPAVKQEYEELYQIYDGTDPENGPMLTPEELQQNRSYFAQYEKNYNLSQKIAQLYREACHKHPVTQTILVITPGKRVTGDLLIPLKKQLEQQKVYQVKYLAAELTSERDLAASCASARYILLTGIAARLAEIDFRPETTCILLNDVAFNLHYRGRNVRNKLYWRRKYDAFRYSLKADYIENPGIGQIGQFISAGGHPLSAAETVKGSCITDLYFDRDYLQNAKNSLAKKCPEIGNRKIILWMGTLRNTRDNPNWMNLPDLDRLAELAGKDYYVLIDGQGRSTFLKQCCNHFEIKGFSSFLPDGITIRQAIAAADVVLGDYRDSFFETTLTGKMVFSTAGDYENYQTRNMIYRYDEINPYVIIQNAEELAFYLDHPEKYDPSPAKQFAAEYLSYCDGKSAERLVQYMIENR